MKDPWRLEVFLHPSKYMKPRGWRLSAHDKEAQGKPLEERIVHTKKIHDRYSDNGDLAVRQGIRIAFRLKNRKTRDIIPADVL